jgi:Lrp/AsnC family transcriptional regulator, leucine-responsive regulatory protein
MRKPDPLDSVDRHLLALLQTDASTTHQVLAEAVGVSTATCHRRIQRLRVEGYIERAVSILSPAHLKAAGLPQLQAIVEVTLDVQTVERLDAFEAQACADAQVQQVYRVSPGPDFVLVVCVPDMDGYQAFARRLLSGDAHVRNVRSYFVTVRAKLTTQLPV